jgi:DNA mismatch repair protein MutS2
VDLLHPEPGLALSAGAFGQALTFAFATGGTGDDFERVLNRARVTPSPFNPDSFVKDLFLAEVVTRCFTVRAGDQERNLHRAQLLREIARPPRDPAVIEFRHRVLRELLSEPELLGAIERTWLEITRLRQLLESPDRGKRYDAIGRRFEILRAVKTSIDVVASGLSTASSALARASESARAFQQSPGYRDLAAVLDHEGHLATVDLRVRIAHDGQVRGFEIVRARENLDNPFYASRFQRALARLASFFGGYRVRQAEILGRLANHAFDGVLDAVMGLFQLGLHLEFYLAAIAFRERALAAGLAVCLPELVEPDAAATEDTSASTSGVRFTALFNPLLLLEVRAPVPCDLELSGRALVIITGPNSGGKTRLLQAVGLAQLLGQAGMFVPARSARLVLRDGMFVSLIQESTADQPEGRLGMELLRIRRLFEELRFNSLVIMDELCSGTNPSEGEEIFQLVVSLLGELEPQAFITTHFLQFAARLERERPVAGLEFLQVELDVRHDPTYGFVAGVAPTSLAGRTAERLGVTRESLEALVEARKNERVPGVRTSQDVGGRQPRDRVSARSPDRSS